jgi:hypothetical protein
MNIEMQRIRLLKLAQMHMKVVLDVELSRITSLLN